MRIKIKSFECPKLKPATHCFIFNLSKWYLDHQKLGRWDDWPSDPAYYIEDCRILWNSTSGVTLERSERRRQYGGLPHYLYSDTFLLLGMFYVHVSGGFACLCHGGICCAQGWHVYEIAKHCPRLGNLVRLHSYFHSRPLHGLRWTLSLLAPDGYWVSLPFRCW